MATTRDKTRPFSTKEMRDVAHFASFTYRALEGSRVGGGTSLELDREGEIKAWKAVFDAHPAETITMSGMQRRTRPEVSVEQTASFRQHVQIQRLQIWRKTQEDVSTDINMEDFKLVYTYLQARDAGIAGLLPPLWDEHIHRLYLGNLGTSVNVPFGTVIGYGYDKKHFKLISVDTFLKEIPFELQPAFDQTVQSQTRVTPEKLNPVRPGAAEGTKHKPLGSAIQSESDSGYSIQQVSETPFETLLETLSIDQTERSDKLWALGKSTASVSAGKISETFTPLSEEDVQLMFEDDEKSLQSINGAGSDVLRDVLQSGFERKTGLLMLMKTATLSG